MNILHITCSPRPQGSHSARLAAAIVERLCAADPTPSVRLRDLAAEPLPHVDAPYADALAGAPHDAGEPGALARSETLLAELELADAIVIGTPMHNFTVPSSLKAWIDHVLRIHRTFAPSPQGKRGLLPNRPVYIAIASGGPFLGEAARQPDFLTPYLRAVLNTMGLFDLHFFVLQGTVRGAEAQAAAWQEAMRQLDLQLPAVSLAPMALDDA